MRSPQLLQNLSTAQLEILCGLNSNGDDGVKKIQQEAAGMLAYYYGTDSEPDAGVIDGTLPGDEEEVIDENDPNRLRKLATLRRRKRSTVANRAKAKKYSQIASKQVVEPPQASLPKRALNKTGNFYDTASSWGKWALSWFTSFRLYELRFDRIYRTFRTSVLPKWYAFLGLSYGVTLILLLGDIFKTVFTAPVVDSENIFKTKTADNLNIKLSKPKQLANFIVRTLWRTYIVASDPIMLSALINEVTWVVVNTVGIVLTHGGLLVFNVTAPILANLIGFTIDPLNDFFNGFVGIWRTWNAISNIDKEIEAAENADERDEKYIHSLKNMRAQLALQRANHLYTTGYKVFFSTLILVGMVLIFNPFTLPALPVAAWFIIGSFIALTSGSLAQGLGKRVFDMGINAIGKAIPLVKKGINRVGRGISFVARGIKNVCGRLWNKLWSKKSPQPPLQPPSTPVEPLSSLPATQPLSFLPATQLSFSLPASSSLPATQPPSSLPALSSTHGLQSQMKTSRNRKSDQEPLQEIGDNTHRTSQTNAIPIPRNRRHRDEREIVSAPSKEIKSIPIASSRLTLLPSPTRVISSSSSHVREKRKRAHTISH